MRLIQTKGMIHAAVGAALLAASCSNAGTNGAATARPAAVDEPCRVDGDCRTGFCDRDRCADPRPEQSYGRDCAPGSSPSDDLGASKLYVCGAYVCREARCRSCVSDQECQAELGAPRCATVNDRPGRRCGIGND